MAEGYSPMSGNKPITLRDRLTRRRGMMLKERASWDDHIRDVFAQTRPRRTRFQQTQVNQGDRRNNQIIDNTGVIAARVLQSGLVNGMSSPATPWFKYEPQDMELLEYGPAKEWIAKLERLVRRVFEASNVYEALPTIYDELALAGTGCGVVEDDFDDVIRVATFTWGEYMLAANERRVIDTLYRDLRMTVLQVVQKFGYKNCSQSVKSLYDKCEYDQWVDVCHCIEPNLDRDPSKKSAGNMPFRSIYWEPNAPASDKDKFLRVSGYRQNPIIAPRWDVVGYDVYGSSCPGMEALGDMRQLQIQQKRKGEAIDKQVRPPTQGPASLADRFVSTLPGAHTTVDQSNGGITPIYQVAPNLQYFVQDIEDTRRRVKEAFFEPYILSISQIEGVQPRNQWEISERKGEGLMVLGPVVQRLQNELHSPLHERTLNRIYEICVPLWQAGENAMIEPPPPELQGMPLGVTYISPLAQLQKQAGVSNIERIITLFTKPEVVAALPDALKKIDGPQAVDDMADGLGLNAKFIRSDQDMEALQAQEAQQQQVQQLAALAAPVKDATAAVKNLSDAKVQAPPGEGQSALESMAEQFSGGENQAA